jgi:hypothetical protein
MTVHRWFANTACPGAFLFERHGYIAEEVNKRLAAANAARPSVKKPQRRVPAIFNGREVMI